MEQPKLPLHGNHCLVCESLDYEVDPTQDDRSVKTLIKKRPVSVATLFPLSAVPEHFLDDIFMKMNYDAFTKLRRSNKRFYQCIENRREKLRIAMFHDRSLEIGLIVTGISVVDCFIFSNSKCPYIISKCDDYLHRQEERKYANGLIRKQTFCSTESIVIDNERTYDRTNYIALFMNAFEIDADLRKEFTGCYKPYLVELNTSITNFQNVINFLTWSKIKLVTLLADLACNELLRVCEIVEPRTLKIEHSRDLSQNILLRDCFKGTKALHLGDDESANCIYPSNLNTLIISGDVEESDLVNMLQTWINGENQLEEMWLQIRATVSLQQFNPVRISNVIKSVKFEKKMNMRVCLLQQRNSGNWAFCAINRQKMSQGFRDVVYFKVIDSTIATLDEDERINKLYIYYCT